MTSWGYSGGQYASTIKVPGAVLEIMVSIQTLSEHFGILSDPKMFGSDIWLSTNQTNVHFTCVDGDVSVLKLTNIYKDKSDATLYYVCTVAHVYLFHKLSEQN